MAAAYDPWRMTSGWAALSLCLAGGAAGYEAADACVVAWWQHWAEGWVPQLGIFAGCALGLALGLCLVRSLRDAVDLLRSAPARGEEGGPRPAKVVALWRGLTALGLLAAFGTLAMVGLRGLGWREVSPAGHGFRVMMPGKPLVEAEGENTPQGYAPGVRFMCRGPERGYELTRLHRYGVMYLDYPRRYLDRNTPARVFKEQRDAVVPSEGKLVSEKSIALDGFPGAEFRVETYDGQRMTCRMYLVRQRLYLVLAKYPQNNPGRGVETFFDSFALTEH